MFISGHEYTRREIYGMLHPSNPSMPGGGNWLTGYVVEGTRLIAFCNIDTPGRNDAFDYPNRFDATTNILTWYGKNKAHSEQPVIKGILIGSLDFHAFVRWNPKDPKFTYLGQGIPKSFRDDVYVDGNPTIEIEFSIHPVLEASQAENRRTPASQKMAIDSEFESECAVCGFNFEAAYGGAIDANACLIPYHVTDKSSRLHEKVVPLCGNCRIAIDALEETDPLELVKIIN